MTQKPDIIYFGRQNSKSYALVIFRDSEVTFSMKGRVQLFVHFSIVFLFIYNVA